MPILLRLDYDAAQRRRIARASEDADQVRRLLALAAIYEGASHTQAAEIGGDPAGGAGLGAQVQRARR